jgi:hypothetical protein
MRSKKRAPGVGAEPAPGDRADGPASLPAPTVGVDDAVPQTGSPEAGVWSWELTVSEGGVVCEGSGAKGSFVVMSPLSSSAAPSGSGGDPDRTLIAP